MKARILVLPLMLATLAVASGCGGASGTTTTEKPYVPNAAQKAEWATQRRAAEVKQAHEEAAEHKKAAAEHKKAVADAKRKARARAVRAKKLHEYEQSPEYKQIQAELHHGEEYERQHKPEAEAKEHEYERRARGELTPEEQETREKDRQESQREVEAIKEGARIKEREEGKVP
jgi:hypothetical protein